MKIFANFILLKALLLNLVTNAIKYQRPGVPPEIHISVQEREEDWLFSVEDNGAGIEEKYYDKIFEIFRRLHTRDEVDGLGLGLALCKKIADLHGGKIWLKSTVGVGTTFFFTIRKRFGL